MRAVWLERMRESEVDRVKRLTDWHPTFAWWPTWVSEGDCRWWEWIERKCSFHSAWADSFTTCEYRATPNLKERTDE